MEEICAGKNHNTDNIANKQVLAWKLKEMLKTKQKS